MCCIWHQIEWHFNCKIAIAKWFGEFPKKNTEIKYKLRTEKKLKLIAIRCRLTIHVAVAISFQRNSILQWQISRMILVKNVTDAEHAHAHCTFNLYENLPVS